MMFRPGCRLPAPRGSVSIAFVVTALASVTLLTSCAAIELLLSPPERPEVSFRDVRVTALSFDRVELEADIDIHNPNRVAVELAGFTYAFDIEASPMLSGDFDRGISIAAEESSSLSVPITLSFADIYAGVSGLADKQEVAYRIAVEPVFDVPVLGVVGVPIERSGTLPLLRLPRVTFAGIELRELAFTRAEIAVAVEVENRNAAAIELHSFDYRFAVDDRRLLDGSLDDAGTVSGGDSRRHTFSVGVGVLEVGRTVWDAIAAGAEVPYELDGALSFGIDIPHVEPTTIPFSFSGVTGMGGRTHSDVGVYVRYSVPK